MRAIEHNDSSKERTSGARRERSLIADSVMENGATGVPARPLRTQKYVTAASTPGPPCIRSMRGVEDCSSASPIRCTSRPNGSRIYHSLRKDRRVLRKERRVFWDGATGVLARPRLAPAPRRLVPKACPELVEGAPRPSARRQNPDLTLLRSRNGSVPETLKLPIPASPPGLPLAPSPTPPAPETSGTA